MSLWQHKILRETSFKICIEKEKISLVCFLLPLKRDKNVWHLQAISSIWRPVEELEGFKQILRMYLFHSWRRLEAGTSITKGYERSPSAQGWEWMTKGHTPGLEAFQGFLLITCFWEQGLLFHDKTPFRVLPKLCYGLVGGNCILCLNAYLEWLRASQPYALFPENYKTTQLDNKLCQSTRGCPWVSFSECGSPSLTPLSLHLFLSLSSSWLAYSGRSSVTDSWQPHGKPHMWCIDACCQ